MTLKFPISEEAISEPNEEIDVDSRPDHIASCFASPIYPSERAEFR